MTTVPTTLPIGRKGLSAWITSCALELAALVSVLPYPIAYLALMQKKTLRAFNTINRETQLSVIRQHTVTPIGRYASCVRFGLQWQTVKIKQIRWKTTDNIHRWQKINKLQPDLLCATVVTPLHDLNHWGIFHVLRVLLLQLHLSRMRRRW